MAASHLFSGEELIISPAHQRPEFLVRSVGRAVGRPAGRIGRSGGRWDPWASGTHWPEDPWAGASPLPFPLILPDLNAFELISLRFISGCALMV